MLTLHQHITLLYGGKFFIFKPDYELNILRRQCELFLLTIPLTYREICLQEKLDVLAYIMQSISPERRKLFSRILKQEYPRRTRSLF